jgi:hypothetical protein
MNKRNKRIGIITYLSLHSNFTNYGTVLQTWALCRKIENMAPDLKPVLVDYCADTMKDKNPLYPIEHMWDTDKRSRKNVEDLMPQIKENYKKIDDFYHTRLTMTDKCYDSSNINGIEKEGICRFIIGSDSIWDIQEFGVDRVFWANVDIMRYHSVTYAPSFQDSTDGISDEVLRELSKNFLKLSARENGGVVRLDRLGKDRAYKVLDPTLLLEADDYEMIADNSLVPQEPYLLFYSRRYDATLERFAYKRAKENSLKMVEISIRSENRDRSLHHYEAGVEEFIALVAHADMIVTNSYHCICFSILYKKDFYCMTREHCVGKIVEILDDLGLSDRIIGNSKILRSLTSDRYDDVYRRLNKERSDSTQYLKEALEAL